MPDLIISQYSFFSALIIFTLVTLLILLLCKNTSFIARHGISIILVAVALTLLRLFLPFDLYWAKVIDLNCILVPVSSFLNQKIVGIYSVKFCLCLIWVLGSIFSICHFAYVFLKDKQALDTLTCIENISLNTAINEYNYQKIVIKVSPIIDVPRVWGVFVSHIYLPDLTLSSNEWKIVLDHEIQHVKNHDTLIKFLMLTIESIFWWNPAVYFLYKKLDHILELRCDLSLSQKYSSTERVKYLEVILKVLRQINCNVTGKSILTTSLVNYSTYASTKQRFEIVSHAEKSSYKLQLCCYLVIFFIFFMSYLIIFQTSFPVPAANGGTAQTSFILHKSDDTYSLYIEGVYYKDLSEKDLSKKEYSELRIVGGN